MFVKGKMVSKVDFSNATNCSKSIIWLLTIALMALLVSAPIHATDPIDVDPDPDFASTSTSTSTTTTMILASGLDQVDLSTLPSGHYLIFVIVEDGPNEIYEIFIL